MKKQTKTKINCRTETVMVTHSVCGMTPVELAKKITELKRIKKQPSAKVYFADSNNAFVEIAEEISVK